jgi:cytochrome c
MKVGRFALIFFVISLFSFPARAEMRGHGGPVRSIAISADGKTAVTGSFDTTVIIWDLDRETAKQVLRFHEGSVNVVRIAGDTGLLTGSDDGTVAFWDLSNTKPPVVWKKHAAPVVSSNIVCCEINNTHTAAVFADGMVTRSALGNGFADSNLSLRAAPLAAVYSNASILVVATADQKLLWIGSPKTITLPSNANTLASAPDGEIIAGGADGKVYVLNADGSIRLTIDVQEMPITSLAVSVDGSLIAAAGLRGAVTILNRATGATISTLVGPGLPVWSLAFHPDGKTILTGGADRVVRKWSVATGQPLSPANAPKPDFPASVMNERGAQVFKACEACHTVTPDGGNRAGPTLHGVFGRKIGTAKDYVYSVDFSKHGIVWNAETIARLFREGPAKVTPGTKMPEQRITDAEDLKALVEWLERVAR